MNLLPLFSKIGLTTGLTIYRIFLCGNRRTHWSKTRIFAEYTVYFRADLLILHFRMSLGARCRRFKSCHSDQKSARAEHNRLIKSIVLSLYLVVLWLFSQPFLFSLSGRVAKKVANPYIEGIMTNFFADFAQNPNALSKSAVLKKKNSLLVLIDF